MASTTSSIPEELVARAVGLGATSGGASYVATGDQEFDIGVEAGLAEREPRLVDVEVSGGMWGPAEGYCLTPRRSAAGRRPVHCIDR